MKGLELSEKYFKEFGLPMLEREFSELMPYLAAGFFGKGSDRFGYDDDFSQDHDFEPGFCIFLPDETVLDRKKEFLLERAYGKLPKEYLGYKRGFLSPVGGNRNGVMRTFEFFKGLVGAEEGKLSLYGWLHVPDHALAEATNGKIFFDSYQMVSRIRQELLQMPKDIRLKRIGGNLLVMGQAGQYNYERCLDHGEEEGAQLALTEFVKAALKVYFLLQDRYLPYYKWSFRALKDIEGSEEIYKSLSFLLKEKAPKGSKVGEIERVSHLITELLKDRNLSITVGEDLEKLAYEVNDQISDPFIRNLNIFEAVTE